MNEQNYEQPSLMVTVYFLQSRLYLYHTILQLADIYSFTSKEANWPPLNPPSEGLRICVQVSRLLEGAVVLIWHGVWTLTDILTTGMVELLLNSFLFIKSRFLCDEQTVSDTRHDCKLNIWWLMPPFLIFYFTDL
jgi:hypothetical protein